MCGIFAAVGAAPSVCAMGVAKLAHRGPDATNGVVERDVYLGHTRLAILDLDHRSDQPFRVGRVTLSYNGELWNYRELRAELRELGRRFKTTGDTEVVVTALDQWGPSALPRFQGMFGLAWTDDEAPGVLWAARDRFGEVPLHAHFAHPFMVASELKALLAAGARLEAVRWVPPGGLVRVEGLQAKTARWYDVPPEHRDLGITRAATRLADAVRVGVRERAISDVPVCTLLSGGIDSAAVAVALKEVVSDVVAYTAVMDRRSPDLKAARLVAETLGIELREVEVRAPTDADLRGVVRAIEMPHKAQVEIGWACLQLARRMRDDGFKVTFSGEGSDELWASYGFAYHGLKTKGWRDYRKDLFVGQHRKNFARCNKVFMAHGVECRLPFLSTGLVELALSLPASNVRRKGRDKAVMQEAFAPDLPRAVVRRQKLAFQDGLRLKTAIAESRGDPKALYRRAFAELFPGVEA